MCSRTCVLFISGCYDGLVYVLAAESGLIVWRYCTEGPVKSSPVLDPFSSLVFIGSHDQHLHALDLKVNYTNTTL